jgi:tetrahydromethanopterin S-methyltransferase subunit G
MTPENRPEKGLAKKAYGVIKAGGHSLKRIGFGDIYALIDERADEAKQHREENFRYLNNKIDSLGQRLDARIDAVDQKVDSLAERIDNRMDALDKKIDTQIGLLRQEMGQVNQRLDTVIQMLMDMNRQMVDLIKQRS